VKGERLRLDLGFVGVAESREIAAAALEQGLELG
jgi:hypothetical protein